jgi:hypothetical protein
MWLCDDIPLAIGTLLQLSLFWLAVDNRLLPQKSNAAMLLTQKGLVII